MPITIPYIISDPYLDANFGLIGTSAVTITGSPVTGALAVFSGDKTITSGNLSGDVTTSDSTVTTLNVNPSKFVQTASKTVANTITETTFVSTGEGSLIIPANTLAVGAIYDLYLVGYASSTGTPTHNFKVYLNATQILTTGPVACKHATDEGWQLRITMVCRAIGASGTIMGQGIYLEAVDPAGNAGLVNTSPTVINTTIDQTVNVTVTWSAASASNTITCAILNLSGQRTPL